MRAIFGILGLVVVVAIVGLLAKKQLTSVAVPSVPITVPGAPPPTPGATTKQQMDSLKQGLESTLQQPRPTADGTK